MNRLEVREAVLCCEACELCHVGSGPVPFSGPTPAYLAIVGEAPGKQADEKGVPFIGPAGTLLREALVGAGIDPDTVAYINAVSCFPDGTPTSAHVHACADNLKIQLEVVDPRWVCFLGGVALSTLRPDLKISRARGHVLLPPARPWKAFVTFHPAYALRQAKGEKILREDLTRLADMMEAFDYPVDEHADHDIPGWLPLSATSCVSCGLEEEVMAEHDLALRTDEMGATYCSLCFEASPQAKGEAKEVKKIERVQAKTGQLFKM